MNEQMNYAAQKIQYSNGLMKMILPFTHCRFLKGEAIHDQDQSFLEPAKVEWVSAHLRCTALGGILFMRHKDELEQIVTD